MSADNWMVCPTCAKEREKVLEQAKSELKLLYGVVSVEEFDRKRSHVAALEYKNTHADRTMREDYTVGVTSTGRFVLDYECSCKLCGSEFERHLDQPALLLRRLA